jgi:hypothetical protein
MRQQGKIVAAARASEVSSKRKKDEEERRKHPDSGFDQDWAKMKAN